MWSSKMKMHDLCSILRLHLRKLTGADGDEATPVPIPNTEVKLISVENTWLATAWEDRAVPVQMKKSLPVCRKGFLLARLFQIIARCSLKMNIGLVFYSYGSIASSSGKTPRLLRRMPFT